MIEQYTATKYTVALLKLTEYKQQAREQEQNKGLWGKT